MSVATETSDAQLLDLMRGTGRSIAELATATQVTPTAVRQRLNRLQGQGLVERETVRVGRGRPRHRYGLTEKARLQAGSNFADLALVLWEEVRAIEDPAIKRGLFERLAASLAKRYLGQVAGQTASERMQSLERLFAERKVPMQVIQQDGRPVLEVLDCPYPRLAEQDRGICAMEKMLFSRLLEQDVRLSQCRLDGQGCCQFETRP